MTMRDSLSKNHGISIMYKYISGHINKEVNWYQLTPKELDNCKCDAVAKNILVFSVENN